MVNVKDVDEVRGEVNEVLSKDLLTNIFMYQENLMKDYKEISEAHASKIYGMGARIPSAVWKGGEHNIQTKAGNHFIYEMLNAAIHEISEAIQALKNWKPWKQTEVSADADHFREEMVDALHFYVEACILAGITPEMLHDLYIKKNKVNKFRQSSNY